MCTFNIDGLRVHVQQWWTCVRCIAFKGPLSTPRLPATRGLEDFQGTLLHSSQWDPSVDLPVKSMYCFSPRICSRTLMGGTPIPPPPHNHPPTPRCSHRAATCYLLSMLTRAILMPSLFHRHDKTVGVIGTGSTGVQLIAEVAPVVKKLIVFQRTPCWYVACGTRHVAHVTRCC